ncbi:34797_t:CDS:2, partial [Racocetra persica]
MAGTLTFKFLRYDIIAAIAEFFGTAYFLFMGIGGAMAFGASPMIAGLGIPFSFGWSLMANVFIWSPISGGVFNPAITIGLMAIKRLTIVRGFLYIIAQFLGALVGTFMIKSLLPVDAVGATVLKPETSVAQGFFLEMFATSFLTFAVLFIASESRNQGFMGPFVVGISLFVSALSVGPFTGASLNPARTFGPAVVFGTYGNAHWIYYIGTTVGSLLAAGYWHLFDKLDFKTVSKTGAVEDEKHDIDEGPKV